MAELKTFDFTGALGRGLQLGQAMRQQENQGKLAALLGQARTTSGPQRDALMGQAYGLDPATGIAADQGFGQLDEAKIKRLGQMAGLFVSMTPEQRAQAWPSIRQEASQIIPTAQYPVNWDESLLPQAQSLHQQLSGIAGAEPFTLGPGSKRFGPDGRVIAEVPFAPKEPSWQLGQDAEGNYIWLQQPSSGGMPATGAMPAPTTGGGGAMLRSSFDDVIGPLLGREGGYVADDAGAGPTNYGINSRANPDVNVASLTPDVAREIYRERYWDAIDADNLPPQIREAAFDAAVNMGVGKARELLQQSGGDPAKFDQLRRQHYGGLVSANPQKYGQYAGGWEKRVAETGGRAVPAGVRGPAKASNVPSGYRLAADGQSLEAIPGGPADKPKAADVTPAQKAVDNAFAKDYVSFVQNGAADARKALDELEMAVQSLESSDKITGPIVGKVPDWVATLPGVGLSEAVDTRETVESTIQRSLRAILGAQFTEKEGERLIRRAYNPALDEATNARRVRSLMTQLERAYEAKIAAAKHYEEHGTLAGFRGPVEFGTGGFNPDAEAPTQANDVDPRRRALLDKY